MSDALEDRLNPPTQGATPEQMMRQNQGIPAEGYSEPQPQPTIDYNLIGQMVHQIVKQANAEQVEKVNRAINGTGQLIIADNREGWRETQRMMSARERVQPAIYTPPVGEPPKPLTLTGPGKVVIGEPVEPELEVATPPFGIMDKEPVSVVTAILTLIAVGLPWLGTSLSTGEMDQLAVSINTLLTAGTLVVGTVSAIIMRMRVNSPATVAKLKQAEQKRAIKERQANG